MQIFHDFMTKLFEDRVANHYHSLNVNKTNLLSRYKNACQILDRIDVAPESLPVNHVKHH
jgi:hypothetical protein